MEREFVNTFHKNHKGFALPYCIAFFIFKVTEWLIIGTRNWKLQACGKLQILLPVSGMSCLVVFWQMSDIIPLTHQCESLHSSRHFNFTAVGSSSRICLRGCSKTDRLKWGSLLGKSGSNMCTLNLSGDKRWQRWRCEKREGLNGWCCCYLTRYEPFSLPLDHYEPVKCYVWVRYKVHGLNSCLRLAHLSFKNQLLQEAVKLRVLSSSKETFSEDWHHAHIFSFHQYPPIWVHLNNTSTDLPSAPLWFQKHTRKVNS